MSFCNLAGLKCGDGVGSLDVDVMLDKSFGDTQDEVVMSSIEHGRVEMRFFARMQFGKRMLNGFYCDLLMCANLYGDEYMSRKYGEETMSVNMKDIHLFSVHTSDDVKDNDERAHRAKMVPAWFNQARLIVDFLYSEDNKTP